MPDAAGTRVTAKLKVPFGFDDPPRLANAAMTLQEALGHYRRVRDEIKVFIEQLPDALHTKRGDPQ